MASSPAEAQTRRVDLSVLVLSGGQDSTAMVKAGLDEGLVPYTEVDLTTTGRTAITEEFLVDTSQPNVRRARFQAVVLPSEAPTALSAAEKEALVRYEREFKIRQLDTYVYPSAAVGLSAPLAGGTLDGATATVTAAGKSSAFAYLQGPVPFEDLDPTTSETYGYVASPLPASADGSFTPMLEATLPGGGARGAILGVYAQDGREEMVFTAAINQYQSVQKLLFPGILNWLTHGVHLGQSRMSLAVHVDDVFRESARFSPDGQSGRRILMTTADVDQLVAWQEQQGMKVDLAFSAGGYLERFADAEVNALGRRLLVNRSLLRWINRTYALEPMDCLRDAAGTCARNAQGQVDWIPYSVVRAAVARNIDFARSAGLRFDLGELITAGYTGLKRPPRDADDNPNLLRVLSELNIGWIATDASVDRDQRAVGTALSVPRYPTNLFPTAATEAEQVRQYNWVFASKADGGSGACESGQYPCRPPLDPTSGFDGEIAPREIRSTLFHVLSNDPRPHQFSQAALTEDRLLYAVVDAVLAAHRSAFTSAAPLGNPTMREVGAELRDRAAWQGARTRLAGYVQGGNVVLSATLAPVRVPLTVALGEGASPSLSSYWGLRNGWVEVTPVRPVQLPLAASVPYGR